MSVTLSARKIDGREIIITVPDMWAERISNRANPLIAYSGPLESTKRARRGDFGQIRFLGSSRNTSIGMTRLYEVDNAPEYLATRITDIKTKETPFFALFTPEYDYLPIPYQDLILPYTAARMDSGLKGSCVSVAMSNDLNELLDHEGYIEPMGFRYPAQYLYYATRVPALMGLLIARLNAVTNGAASEIARGIDFKSLMIMLAANPTSPLGLKAKKLHEGGVVTVADVHAFPSTHDLLSDIDNIVNGYSLPFICGLAVALLIDALGMIKRSDLLMGGSYRRTNGSKGAMMDGAMTVKASVPSEGFIDEQMQLAGLHNIFNRHNPHANDALAMYAYNYDMSISDPALRLDVRRIIEHRVGITQHYISELSKLEMGVRYLAYQRCKMAYALLTKSVGRHGALALATLNAVCPIRLTQQNIDDAKSKVGLFHESASMTLRVATDEWGTTS